MLRCILVDDEEKSRDFLRILLEGFCANAEVVGMASNVSEGFELINSQKPDVVFLDIRMRQETGFDLLDKFENISFEIIFTTAFSEYALSAIKYASSGYLLKPIDVNELQSTLNRLDDLIQKRLNNKDSKNTLEEKEFRSRSLSIPLYLNKELKMISIDDIISIEWVVNQCKITTHTNVYTSDTSLKEYENLLPSDMFFRIHLDFIISIKKVKIIEIENTLVRMTDESVKPISSRKIEALQSAIKRI